MAIERPAGFALSHRGWVSVPGNGSDMVFTVRNTGDAELTSLSITLDGPDAAAFTVILPPAPLALAPGGSTTFRLRPPVPVSGRDGTVLRIAGNFSDGVRSADLTLRSAPGTGDQTFNPRLQKDVFAIAVQPDGKILAGSQTLLERFHPDGTPDHSFSVPIDNPVACIVVQKDGKILLGGFFRTVGGKSLKGIARLNPDGSVDETFVPNSPSTAVGRMAIQPDGKILAGGLFDFTSTNQTYMARLNPNGTRDVSFRPKPDSFVSAIFPQPDGKILIGGSFTQILSKASSPEVTPPQTVVVPSRVARLNADGTVYPLPAPFEDGVGGLAVQPDGRIVAGGAFAGGLARLLPDGQLDVAFSTAAGGPVRKPVLQADGACLVYGDFNALGGENRRGLGRTLSDGSLDPFFHPEFVGGPETPLLIFTSAIQPDGRILIGGRFSSIDSEANQGLARLESGPAINSLHLSGRSAIRWMRGGSAPEVWDATFDLKPSGAAVWTRLGSAVRIPGGWQLSGLTLPGSGQIRAQAYAENALMESVAPILPPLESWRLQFFNTSDNTGPAADDADPDNDGLTNFTEFAFGLNPVDRTSNALPEFKYANNSFTATFTAPAGREDLLYSAEWSPSMQPGTWAALPDTGSGASHAFRLPGSVPRGYLRFTLKVR